MRWILVCAAVAPLVVAASCKRQDDASQQPAMTPTATGAYSGYPPPGQPPPGQPPPPGATYYTQYPPGQMPGAPTPVAPPPGAVSSQMATPGPLAFQCTNDVPCGTHRCNVQYGKCAFPCQTNVDCLAPNTCMSGLCVPPFVKAPGSP